jgi:hypothetical protein
VELRNTILVSFFLKRFKPGASNTHTRTGLPAMGIAVFASIMCTRSDASARRQAPDGPNIASVTKDTALMRTRFISCNLRHEAAHLLPISSPQVAGTSFDHTTLRALSLAQYFGVSAADKSPLVPSNAKFQK